MLFVGLIQPRFETKSLKFHSPFVGPIKSKQTIWRVSITWVCCSEFGFDWVFSINSRISQTTFHFIDVCCADDVDPHNVHSTPRKKPSKNFATLYQAFQNVNTTVTTLDWVFIYLFCIMAKSFVNFDTQNTHFNRLTHATVHRIFETIS